MTKIIFMATFTLLSGVASADALRDVQDCYNRTTDDRGASYCATNRLARELEMLKRDMGQQPPPMSDVISVEYCDSNGDPGLHRKIFDSRGQVIRDDLLKTFTEGDDDAESLACAAEVRRQEARIPNQFRTQCTCSNDGDPYLVLDVMDARYATVAKLNLIQYRAGDDNKERSDCMADQSAMPICRGN